MGCPMQHRVLCKVWFNSIGRSRTQVVVIKVCKRNTMRHENSGFPTRNAREQGAFLLGPMAVQPDRAAKDHWRCTCRSLNHSCWAKWTEHRELPGPSTLKDSLHLVGSQHGNEGRPLHSQHAAFTENQQDNGVAEYPFWFQVPGY